MPLPSGGRARQRRSELLALLLQRLNPALRLGNGLLVPLEPGNHRLSLREPFLGRVPAGFGLDPPFVQSDGRKEPFPLRPSLGQLPTNLFDTPPDARSLLGLPAHVPLPLLGPPPVIGQTPPGRPLPPTLLPGRRKRLVHPRLNHIHNLLEPRILRERIQRLGQPITSRGVGVVREALLEDRLHLALIRQQRRGDERRRHAASATTAGRLDAPAQELLQSAVDLAAPRVGSEVLPVAGRVEERLAAAAGERLADAPDAAVVVLEGHAYLGGLLSVPVLQVAREG